ncbi:hypothetical protein WJX72_006659 [[Myrmecia] bisecta]|uniref:Uncharacterized protein n=1 Tax=[Myrmecia] bisecta TaxID=41462 RepID=A0AAW1PT13_9CHLO
MDARNGRQGEELTAEMQLRLELLVFEKKVQAGECDEATIALLERLLPLESVEESSFSASVQCQVAVRVEAAAGALRQDPVDWDGFEEWLETFLWDQHCGSQHVPAMLHWPALVVLGSKVSQQLTCLEL